MRRAAISHQEWLVHTHCQLDTKIDIQPGHGEPASTDAVRLTEAEARATFSQWDWSPMPRTFRWRPKIPTGLPPPATWRHTKEESNTICTWARTLRWQQKEDASIAFCELAIAFHTAGYRLAGDYNEITIHTIACKIRQAFQYLIKDERVQLCPGSFHATFVKSAGRTLAPSSLTPVRF